MALLEYHSDVKGIIFRRDLNRDGTIYQWYQVGLYNARKQFEKWGEKFEDEGYVINYSSNIEIDGR